MSSAYDKVVKGGKLTLKGGLPVSDLKISKKKKKKKAKDDPEKPKDAEDAEEAGGAGEGDEKLPDGGTGFLPQGKGKSKTYEELFDIESKRFGVKIDTKSVTREEALDMRAKKKADRYCK